MIRVDAHVSPCGCGDGVTNVTAGEACDDMGPSLSCDADCTPVDCGDGVANAVVGEDCDDAGESTECDADCTSVVCGDETINVTAGEQCEGGDLGGETCVSQGFDGGTLGCNLACGYNVINCADLPGMPVLMLGFSPVKRFDFSWAAVVGAEYYQREESAAPGEPFLPLGGNIVGTSVSHGVPLHLRWQASYRLRACNVAGCTESAAVDVVGTTPPRAPAPSISTEECARPRAPPVLTQPFARGSKRCSCGLQTRSHPMRTRLARPKSPSHLLRTRPLRAQARSQAMRTGVPRS